MKKNEKKAKSFFGHYLIGNIKDPIFFFISASLIFSCFIFNNFITYDGHLYYKLSKDILSWDFMNWDFLRTPIYPFSIAFVEVMIKFSSQSYVYLNTIFLILSCFLLTNLMKGYCFSKSNIFLVNLAFLSPAVITYQHGFLSESGLLLVLVSILFFSLKNFTNLFVQYFIYLLVFTCAYYYKPHFKYLAVFFIPFLYFIKDLYFSSNLSKWKFFSSWKFPVFTLIFFFILIGPWENFLNHSGRNSHLNYYPLVMGVVPLTEANLGEHLMQYKKMLEAPIGRSGLPPEKIYPMLESINKNLLAESFFVNTLDYFNAIFKTLSIYIYPSNNETSGYFYAVSGQGNIDHTLIVDLPQNMSSLHEEVKIRFLRDYHRNSLANYYYKFSKIFIFFISIITLILPITFLVSIIRRNLVGSISSALSLSYLFMHAIVLMCIDRFFAPVIPLIFLATVATFFHKGK
jgi:hypothetical protein